MNDVEVRFLAACLENPDAVVIASADEGIGEDDFSEAWLRQCWNELLTRVRKEDVPPSRAYMERILGPENWATLDAERAGLRKVGTTHLAMGDAREVRRLADIRRMKGLFAEASANLDDARADPDVIRSRVSGELLKEQPVSRVAGMAEAAPEMLEAVGHWLRGESFACVPTGFPTLDESTGGGWPESTLGTIGGRKHSCKTALAMQMLANVAEAGYPGLMVSLEMTREQLLLRHCCRELNVSVSDLRARKMKGQEALLYGFNAEVEKASRMPLLIYDGSGLTVQGLADLVKLAILRHSVAIAFVDYVELVSVPGAEGLEQVTAVFRTFKDTAKQYRTPVVLLSQLGRRTEAHSDKMPDDADLRYGGEAESDQIILLWNIADYQSRGQSVTVPKQLLDSGVVEKDPATGLPRRDRLWGITSKAKWGKVGVWALGANFDTGRLWDLRGGVRIERRDEGI